MGQRHCDYVHLMSRVMGAHELLLWLVAGVERALGLVGLQLKKVHRLCHAQAVASVAAREQRGMATGSPVRLSTTNWFAVTPIRTVRTRCVRLRHRRMCQRRVQCHRPHGQGPVVAPQSNGAARWVWRWSPRPADLADPRGPRRRDHELRLYDLAMAPPTQPLP